MIQFHPSRSAALQQLQAFVDNHLSLYARDRNFDFGPDQRTNTSCLSPYVTHGILSENEIKEKGNYSYWQKLAEVYNLDSINQSLQMRCGNCAAFVITSEMKDCIKKR